MKTKPRYSFIVYTSADRIHFLFLHRNGKHIATIGPSRTGLNYYLTHLGAVKAAFRYIDEFRLERAFVWCMNTKSQKRTPATAPELT